MITLECNYSKKLGLPQYSSHQFSITLRTEIPDLAQVQSESARLYKLLQEGVDSSIKEVGFLPSSNGGSNGHSNGRSSQASADKEIWKCSDKQRDLIQKMVIENNLDKAAIEQLATDRFGKGVRALDKLQASALIEELFEMTGQKSNGKGRFQNRYQPKASGR